MPNRPQTPPAAYSVEILGFRDAQLLDITGPLQVLASANALAATEGSRAFYDIRLVGPEGRVVTSSGLVLDADPLPRQNRAIDTLIVVGGGGVTTAAADRRLIGWLTARAARARRVVSICTGAFLLAEAGLLSGRRAVTHWAECGRLARSHPDLHVDADSVFIKDGNVWTSAGVTAGIDLALALVEEDRGPALAAAIARDLVVFLRRPGGQAQFGTLLAMNTEADEFAALHAWVNQNLHRSLSISVLANRSGMSDRSFQRHYRSATGLTPARAVERFRVEAARQLLGTTRRSIKHIVRFCGFGSEETMRRCFVRHLGVPPTEYRRRFSEIGR